MIALLRTKIESGMKKVHVVIERRKKRERKKDEETQKDTGNCNLLVMHEEIRSQQ